MTFILVISTFPTEQSENIGKKLTSGKLAELPDFVKQVNIFVYAEGEIKTYAIYEAPDDKMKEANIALGKRYAGYYGIKGFKYTIRNVLTIAEALPLIGLG